MPEKCVFKTYFVAKKHKKYVFKTYFSVKKAKMYMYGLACVRRWTDGHADGVLKIDFHRCFLKTPLKQGKMHFLPHFGLFSENRDESLKITFHCGFLKTGQNEVKSAFYPVLEGFSENHMRFLGDYLYF
jgi:hypothetical protein